MPSNVKETVSSALPEVPQSYRAVSCEVQRTLRTGKVTTHLCVDGHNAGDCENLMIKERELLEMGL